jgi:hypothetical protein
MGTSISDGISAAARQLQGAVEGYWFGPEEALPAVAPGYRPTGALLPEVGTSLEGGSCLDLVRFDDEWFPLSEAGAWTYAHSAELIRGRGYRFIPVGDPWGKNVYAVEAEDWLDDIDQIMSRFGAEVAARARTDYPALLVRARRIAD